MGWLGILIKKLRQNFAFFNENFRQRENFSTIFRQPKIYGPFPASATTPLFLLPAEATAVLFLASSLFSNREHDNLWTAALV